MFLILDCVITVLLSFILQFGTTALMLASSEGHSDIVPVLLAARAQVDLQDKVIYSV